MSHFYSYALRKVCEENLNNPGSPRFLLCYVCNLQAEVHIHLSRANGGYYSYQVCGTFFFTTLQLIDLFSTVSWLWFVVYALSTCDG